MNLEEFIEKCLHAEKNSVLSRVVYDIDEVEEMIREAWKLSRKELFEELRDYVKRMEAESPIERDETGRIVRPD